MNEVAGESAAGGPIEYASGSRIANLVVRCEGERVTVTVLPDAARILAAVGLSGLWTVIVAGLVGLSLNFNPPSSKGIQWLVIACIMGAPILVGVWQLVARLMWILNHPKWEADPKRLVLTARKMFEVVRHEWPRRTSCSSASAGRGPKSTRSHGVT